MRDYEQLGAFYLGREYELADARLHGEPLLYDAKDLTTHAVCVGMTGSGKTGLCLVLLEEAALDGIPAIAIDPKGDLGNLLLTFPQLRASDFRPWIDESEAARKNLSPDELAAQTAERWRAGLAEWDEDGERIARFRQAVDSAIYTPGSSAGLPLSVLRSFDAPPEAVRGDGDLLRERVTATVSGLLALAGRQADPIRSREHILISTLLDAAWRKGESLDLATLVGRIQDPPMTRIGTMDADTFFPPKQRTELAMQINNLLASPGFAAWMEGEPLDVGRLLYTAEGKPRLSILSIAHLSDAERMFFVTILLNEVLAWVRTQSGTSSLRAILYMDEVFGYFPPTANPPSKPPMLTLLKQARAFGLGIVLATQNPVDLDYKGLSNTGTWFLGRLQTERDKLRVLEGLEGASATAGANFDRGKMEATLAALGNRVFLLNNVHEDRPVTFQTRWSLSYLRGPLTRGQIHTLMAERKRPADAPDAADAQRPLADPPPARDAAASGPPEVAARVEQVYLRVSEAAAGQCYRPALFAAARLNFVDAKAEVNRWQEVGVLSDVDPPEGDPWTGAEIGDRAAFSLADQPQAGVAFAPLPAALASAANYAAWAKALSDYLYRRHVLELWQAPAFRAFSRPEESEVEFRVRMAQRVRELRDEAMERLRGEFSAKGGRLDEQIQQARERVARERSEFHSSTVDTAVSFGSAILQAIFGRKWASVTNVRRGTTAARSASRAARQHGDVDRANERLDELLGKRAELEREYELKLADLKAAHQDPQIEPYVIRPRKRGLSIDQLCLAWVV